MVKNLLIISSVVFLSLCTPKKEEQKEESAAPESKIEMKLKEYARVPLTADMSMLTDNQKKMIPILIEAAKIMDDLFWQEAYGNKEELLGNIKDEATREYVKINYGPWDRLSDNEPFVEGFGEKPAGAQFYPKDITKEEFEAFDSPDKASLYTMVRRGDDGSLQTIPYHEYFADQVRKASDLLRQAAELADNNDLKRYLTLRAAALLSDEYQPSDLAWMDMKTNVIEVVIGPIENYEDALYNYKAAHEAYVLIKDVDWSNRLAKYAEFLPQLQKNLPVDEKYKKDTPGRDSQINAYDVVYYAGDCNAGSKTIAINLPNDVEVQKQKGSRRLQLKNAMKAKFDKIMVPIANLLIAEDQRSHVTFDAFFANTMFHEVAHGLGVKNTITGKGTVRQALKEKYSAIEEGKADILGLYMVKQLHEMGEVEGDLMDYYVTFLAGIFRSVRFGAADAHGQANMIRFNYFKEMNAFSRDENGYYSVNVENFEKAMEGLSQKILTLQGDGDYDATVALFNEMGMVKPDLQADLDRVADAGIPRDIVFDQGVDVLGLK